MKHRVTFITEGDGDPGIVRDELRTLEARKRELEQSLHDNLKDSSVEVHPNIGELYAKKVGELRILLTDDKTRPQAIDIIRSMIERVEVSEGVERSKPSVVLVGDLALPLLIQHKSPDSSGIRAVRNGWLRGEDLNL